MLRKKSPLAKLKGEPETCKKKIDVFYVYNIFGK